MRGRRERSHRAHALHAFIASAAATSTWLFIGRRRWFTADEWSILAGRDGATSTTCSGRTTSTGHRLPILVTEACGTPVGLRSYVACRRRRSIAADGRGWLALLRSSCVGAATRGRTAAASAFARFGAGADSISVPFQIGSRAYLGLALRRPRHRRSGSERFGPTSAASAAARRARIERRIALTLVACVACSQCSSDAACAWTRGRRAARRDRPGGVRTGGMGCSTLGHRGDVARVARLNLRFTFDALGARRQWRVVLAMVLVSGSSSTFATGPEVRERLRSSACWSGAVASDLHGARARRPVRRPGMGADAGRFVGGPPPSASRRSRWPHGHRDALASGAWCRWPAVQRGGASSTSGRSSGGGARTSRSGVPRPMLAIGTSRRSSCPAPCTGPALRASVTIGWLLDGVDSGRIPPPVGRSDLNLTSVAGLGLPRSRPTPRARVRAPRRTSSGQRRPALASGPCAGAARPRRRRRAW